MRRSVEDVVLMEEHERDHQGVRKRLRELKRRCFGGNAAEMARTADLDRSTLNRVLKGDTETVTDHIVAHVLNNVKGKEEQPLNERWLEKGEGEIWSNTQGSKPARRSNGDMQIKNVTNYGPASAGDGRNLEPKGTIEMNIEQYRTLFGSRSVEEVGFFEIDGDSAVPVYFDGEHIPVEIIGDTQEFREDTVYVFRHNDDIMVKRLRSLGDDQIRAESLNPAIDNRILEVHDDNFEIVGRVIDNEKQQLYTSLVGRFLRGKGQETA